MMSFNEDAFNPASIISYLQSMHTPGIIANYSSLNNENCTNTALTILDFNTPSNIDFTDVLNQHLLKKTPLLLFNPGNNDYLLKTLGININSEWLLIQPYANYTVINVSSKSSATLGSKCFDGSTYASSADEDDLPSCNQAAASCIHYGLTHPVLPVNDLPALPSDQYKRYYINQIKASRNLKTTYYTQEATVDVVLEVTVVASYNAIAQDYKYVSIRTAGAGCNPQMLQNSSTYRGFFQGLIHLDLKPDSDLFHLYSNEPQNINNVTTYTTTSTLNIGIDISKNPSFSPSYSLSESATTNISDFVIINNTSGSKAAWDFKLSYVHKGIKSLFNHKTFKHDTVKEIPLLASANLQPITSMVWFVDNTYSGKVTLNGNFAITYYEAWTTQAAGHTNTLKYDTPLKIEIDMGAVQA